MDSETISKTRNWFITINEGSESYSKIADILNDIKCQYCYIYHKADITHSNNHIHLLLFFDNARTFEQVLKIFNKDGSDIQPMRYKCKSYRYLLHDDNDDKTTYNINDVIGTSYCIQQLKYYLENDEFYYFNEDEFLTRIENGDIHNFLDCINFFGVNQCNRYRGLINQVLSEKPLNVDKDKIIYNLQNENLFLNQTIDRLTKENEILLDKIKIFEKILK